MFSINQRRGLLAQAQGIQASLNLRISALQAAPSPYYWLVQYVYNKRVPAYRRKRLPNRFCEEFRHEVVRKGSKHAPAKNAKPHGIKGK